MDSNSLEGVEIEFVGKVSEFRSGTEVLLRKQLSELFVKAELSGQFRVRVIYAELLNTNKFNGFRFEVPVETIPSILFEWKSRKHKVQGAVFCPEGMSSLDMYWFLKRAAEKPQQQQGDATVIQQQPLNPILAKILGEPTEVPDMSLVPVTLSAPTTNVVIKDKGPSATFLADYDKDADYLAMIALSLVGIVDEDGSVETEALVSILRESFGFPKEKLTDQTDPGYQYTMKLYRSVYPAIRGLINRGVFDSIARGKLRVSQDMLNRIKANTPVEHIAPAPVVAVVADATLDVSGFVRMFEDLATRVGGYEKLRTKVEALQEEHDHLKSTIEELRVRELSVLAELERAKSTLQDPAVIKDIADYDVIVSRIARK